MVLLDPLARTAKNEGEGESDEALDDQLPRAARRMTERLGVFAPAHRYFLAVAAAGSVRAAARELNIAASAISRQIIGLEHQLGLPLFERGARQLTLSPAGESLLRGLRRAAQEAEDVLEEIDNLKGLKRGVLRIASVESISVSFLPDVLQAFAASFPGIETTVTITGSDAVTELVRSHAADVGLTFNPAALDGLDAVITRDFEIGAIMAPDHPLASAASLSLGECLQHRVAWPAKGLSLRLVLDRAKSRKSAAPPMIECNSLRFMAALARRGDCIAFQPPIGIEQDLSNRALVWVPLKYRIGADTFMAVCRKGHRGRATIEAFLGSVRSRLDAVRK